MQDLYQKFHRAEVLIFATPVYWWNITSQLKRFMDRMYAIDVESGFKNKKFVLLLTYGGALPNSGPELVQRTFKEICDYVHMDFVQFYGTCTDDYKPVEENQEAQEAVYEMGKAL
jgi:multimeric flavodoxin WrbA